MLGRLPLIAFIPIRDVARARPFYESTLGLTVIDETPFALVIDANGTMLRLTPITDLVPQPFTVAGWVVPDIEATVAELTTHGVTCKRFAGMEQNAAGIWAAPGGDFVAWFEDPDGNTLSLTQFRDT